MMMMMIKTTVDFALKNQSYRCNLHMIDEQNEN